MNQSSAQNIKWYQKGWGIVLLGVSITMIGIILVIGGFTIHYLWKITHGEGEHLALQFSSAAFTQSVKYATVINPPVVSRGDLEGGNYPFLGSEKPKVTVVEFFDFRCPYCKQATPIIEEMMKEYGDKVKFIARNFPAESLHPGTTDLARLGYCAKEQGRFWPIYFYFYNNQDLIPEIVTEQYLTDIARSNDLDLDRFTKCLHDPATLVAVNKDYTAGFNFGVEGTPTFFINGERITGVIPLDGWRKIFKNL
jgi:protein-disulfide isomerase